MMYLYLARCPCKDHLEHCIVDAVQTQDFAAIDELNRAIEQFVK